MIGGLDRGADIGAGRAPESIRRKILFVTTSLPGHDAGFAQSGHAHYLASFIDYFVARGDDVVLVIGRPRLDVVALRPDRLPYRIASRALTPVGKLLLVTDRAALRATLSWLVYSRLPRALQEAGSVARGALRKARGYAHVLGSFITAPEIDFVKRRVAAEQPDLILYDGIFNACGRLSEAEHWIVTHEVKHQRAASFAERGVAVTPAGLSRESERALLAEVGNVIAIQWDDADEFARMLPAGQTVVVPVTIEQPARRRDRSAALTGRCLFVGSGSFHNLDGIRWFLDSCWASIRAAVPDATLDIFGTVCYRLADLPAGVVAHGTAPDLASAYARASVAIVPLQIGSGLKVKLIEALAFGLPVVTTPVGAQGLSTFLPRPFLLAANAADFSAACVTALTDAALASHLSAAAEACAGRFTPQRAFAAFAAATAAPRGPQARAVRIGIAVPTFRREELLGRLLDGIARQTIDARAQIDVVILDNDPAAGAAPLVTQRRTGFPFPLHYEHVPEPGLATVRNRALAFARSRFDYIALIDDDEVPDPHWLGALLAVALATRAPVVVGPVYPVVPPGAPQWIADLRSKETPLHRNGALLRDGWSCNALVDLRTVAAVGVTFDPALNFAGGEDQLFFRQLHAFGARIVFAAEATVRETIGAGRLTLRFNLLRAFRRGNSLSFCERRMLRGPGARLIRVAKAGRLIALGLVRMTAGLRPGGERALVVAACDVANGLGMLCGLVGKMYQAYRREP